MATILGESAARGGAEMPGACPRCPEGVLLPTSAAQRSPLARTAAIVLMALSTPFLFYGFKVLESVPSPAGQHWLVGLWLSLSSVGLFVGAAVPLSGVWVLRRKTGGMRRCSACEEVFEPGPLGTFVPRA